MNKNQSKQDKLLAKAQKEAEKRIKEGSLKEYDIANYIRGYMKESSKY